MTHFGNTVSRPRSAALATIALFLLPALSLASPVGMGLIEIFVILAGIVGVAARIFKLQDFQSARWIILAFSLNLLLAIVSIMLHKSKMSFIDNPSRQLLVMCAIGLILYAKPKSDALWLGLLVGAIAAALLALFQKFALHADRAGGFHQIIMFGDIAMAMGLMSLANIEDASKSKVAWMPFVTFIAGLIASLLSGSRGGWLALACSFIPLYTYGPAAVRKNIVYLSRFALGFVVLACLIPQFGVLARILMIWDDLQQLQLGNVNTSIGARLDMWRGAWTMFVEHPLFGVGRAEFHNGLVDLAQRGVVGIPTTQYFHAHNEILNALATEGLFGALSIVFVYLAPAQYFLSRLRSAQTDRHFALAGFILVLSFIDFGLTQVMFAHHIGSGFYALCVFVLVGLCERERVQQTKPEARNTPLAHAS